jgi:hypothetical protein
MHACMHVCIYACMHVCMYAFMHLCLYVCVDEGGAQLMKSDGSAVSANLCRPESEPPGCANTCRACRRAPRCAMNCSRSETTTYCISMESHSTTRPMIKSTKYGAGWETHALAGLSLDASSFEFESWAICGRGWRLDWEVKSEVGQAHPHTCSLTRAHTHKCVYIYNLIYHICIPDKTYILMKRCVTDQCFPQPLWK